MISCGELSCAAARARFVASVGVARTHAAQSGGVIAVPQPVLLSAGEGMVTLVELLARQSP